MSTATDMLAAYQAAELAVLKGLSYRIGDLQLTRADLAQIRAGRIEWQCKVSAELAGVSGRSAGVAIADFGDGQCER
jgi:hypothetical protein